MLQITIPAQEMFDESKNEFVYTKEQTLQLEHSLVSLSKWESKWCKPFLTKEKRSYEETVDYIKCMTLTQNVKSEVYSRLTNENISEVNKYIEAPMTASTVPKKNKGSGSKETVTSELIYYWMITLGIPVEFQKWHLNRLIMLIDVCNFKNNPPTRGSTRDLMTRNHALNMARRKQLNTRG